MEHRLKTLPEHFCEVAAGRKRFEVRKDDREPPYKPDDTLLLEEWAGNRYTGEWIRVHVDLVLRGEYCKDGYCIMSITPMGGNGLTPPTRADRFRAMSDKKMSTQLIDMIMDVCEDGVPTEDYMLDWLTQPAEED